MVRKVTYKKLESKVRKLEQEVAECNQLRELLKKYELRGRLVFDQTFQFIGLLTIDGTLIEANEAALSFAEVSESEVIGKPFWETVWWAHSPDLQKQLQAR
jgi:PAS domain-containing protein